MATTPSTEHTEGELYLGAMSGTSLDGIDVALVDFSSSATVLAHQHLDYDNNTRAELRELCEAERIAPEALMEMDARLGAMIARCCQQLLGQHALKPAQICAIGSHGQTIRHVPPAASSGTSWQIGDPNTLAAHTGIPVVADFRRANLALGGHGAPLAPAFHAAFFSDQQARAVVNVGGMANITVLQPGADVVGFDTGPGNVLMDYWIGKQRQQSYDKDGAWAASGQCQPDLLKDLLSLPFFTLAPPKSTGREQFNAAWLESILQRHAQLDAADVQATLLELTARSIADAALLQGPIRKMFICGGGAYNNRLLQRLEQLLPDCEVSTSQILGIPPDLVECAAFAWFAKQTMGRHTVATRSFTGGERDTVLGGIYWG